eukprot:7333747-Alexandrium_andersonii.AAC.1
MRRGGGTHVPHGPHGQSPIEICYKQAFNTKRVSGSQICFQSVRPWPSYIFPGPRCKMPRTASSSASQSEANNCSKLTPTSLASTACCNSVELLSSWRTGHLCLWPD